MAVIGQSHLLWRSRVPDHIYHSNSIVRIVPTEVVHYNLEVARGLTIELQCALKYWAKLFKASLA